MSVESKIKQLLEGKTEDQSQLTEAEHMAKKPEDLSSVSVGNVGQKTSTEMKKDTSKAGKAANQGDASVLPNLGNSAKPTVDEFGEDEKNPGAKAAAKVIYAKNPSSISAKGDAKSVQVPGVTAKSGVSSMTVPASEEVQTTENEQILEVDITEELAIQWCKDSMGEEAVTSIESSIASQIEESKAPSVIAEVPW